MPKTSEIEDDDVEIEEAEPLEEDGDDEDEVVEAAPYANKFEVEDADGKVVMRRRPGARLTYDEALNLAAHIVATVGTDIEDFEALVNAAIEEDA